MATKIDLNCDDILYDVHDELQVRLTSPDHPISLFKYCYVQQVTSMPYCRPALSIGLITCPQPLPLAASQLLTSVMLEMFALLC